jgi:hypothetical protein
VRLRVPPLRVVDGAAGLAAQTIRGRREQLQRVPQPGGEGGYLGGADREPADEQTRHTQPHTIISVYEGSTMMP